MKSVLVSRTVTTSAMLAYVAIALSSSAIAQTATLPASAIPDLVTVPNGVNLGGTSFYDGFSTLEPGFAVLQYLRYNAYNKIADKNGNDNPLFQNPHIDAVTSVTQFSVSTPWAINGNRVGFNLLVPVTYINGKFGPVGRQLRDNGTGVGDITFGPYLQFKPVMMQGHPVLSVRVTVDVLAPTGKFNRARDLNQGTGYWSINPHVAWTLLPARKWEISGRTQYLYSLETSKISDPPAIPGFSFRNGQAGQLLWTNFDISREVTRGVAIGLNGFAVKQITNNRINNISLPNTKRSAVYIGPGFHVDRMPKFSLNANLYLPVSTSLYATGPQINLQLIAPLKLGASSH